MTPAFWSAVSAIGSFASGAAHFLSFLQRGPEGHGPSPHLRFGRSIWVCLVLASCLSLALAGNTFPDRVRCQRRPWNVCVTSAAWNALDQGNYLKASRLAGRVVAALREDAELQQDSLTLAGAIPPPIGPAIGSEARSTLVRGQLNDVATCLYITGFSAEHLGDFEAAKRAYRDAASFTYGRTWNRQGFFWSPSQLATNRLRAVTQFLGS
jgi:hypothetical protein